MGKLFEAVFRLYEKDESGIVRSVSEPVGTFAMRYGEGYESRDLCWEAAVRMSQLLMDNGTADFVQYTCRVIGGGV